MRPMKEVLYLVVHCSCTRPNQAWTVDDIDRCHRAKNWAMIGYHWVIYQDGSIHKGRDEKYAGAHVRHYNDHAIGICYIGGMDAKAATPTPALPSKKPPCGIYSKTSSSRTPTPKSSVTATSRTSPKSAPATPRKPSMPPSIVNLNHNFNL